MTWNHKETAGLARQTCRFCDGEGLRGRRYDPQPCNCVLRSIFRLCYRRFRRCVTSERTLSKVCLTQYSGKDRNRRYERLVEDYIADFCLIAKRFLDEFEHRVFRVHFLLGADWHLCCRQMNVDRGEFFHAVYRIENKLGKAFRELEPYGLFPIDEYFATRVPDQATRAKVVTMPAKDNREERRSLRPPLRLRDTA